MQIIAHRGASGVEPENTIRSFKHAENVGADMVELDVRQSKDGEIVVFHDRDFFRLFGDPRTIKEMTLAEIKRISMEHHREIPTLQEVLSSVQAPLQIEIKSHGIEEQVVVLLKSFPHKVLISSFFPGILKKVRALDGNMPLALIIGIKQFHMISLANYFAKKLNLFAIHPRHYIVSAPILALLRLSRRKIYVWTVNSKAEYQRMQKLGVDGILTDYPELIKEWQSKV